MIETRVGKILGGEVRTIWHRNGGLKRINLQGTPLISPTIQALKLAIHVTAVTCDHPIPNPNMNSLEYRYAIYILLRVGVLPYNRP